MAAVKMSLVQLRQLRSIGLLLSSNFVAAAVISVGTLLVSRIVAPSAFGTYSYAAQIAVAVYPALTFRYEQALPLLGKRPLARSYLLLGTLIILVITSIFLFFAGRAVLGLLAERLELRQDLNETFSLIVLVAFSLSLAGVYQSASLAVGDTYRMAIARVLRAAVMVALQLIFIVAIGGGATWLLIADLGASLMQAVFLAGGVGVITIFQIFRRPFSQLIRRQLVLAQRHKAFPLIMLPHLLAHSILGLMLTSVLGLFYGTAALGQYYLMRKLIYGVLAQFGTASYQWAIAESAKVQRKEVYGISLRVLLFLGVVTLVSAVVILITGPKLFAFAAGEEWTMAGRMAIAVLPLIIIEPIASALAFVPVFLGLQRIAFGVAVLQGVLGVLTIAGAGLLGWNVLAALAMSSLAMSLVMACYVIWLLRKARKVSESSVK